MGLPIIVGISGASGFIYGHRLLQFLLENNYKVELVISKNAVKVANDELKWNLSFDPEVLREQVLSGLKIQEAKSLNVWKHDDIAASISSGSYKTQGMIIIPASMGTVGALACGISNNLLVRAADVCLKEKRKLVIVPREMPLNSIHLENLLKLSNLGITVAPACPGFYSSPKLLIEVVDFVVGKVLDIFGVEHNLFKRWQKSSYELNENSLSNLILR